jgi:hypothetical protein
MNASELPPAVPPTEPEAPKRRLNWLLLFLVLLAPAVLTFIGADAGVDGLAIAAPLLGGGIAGLACGVRLALPLGKTSRRQGSARLSVLCSSDLVELCLGLRLVASPAESSWILAKARG